jgi:hypothetical protein
MAMMGMNFTPIGCSSGDSRANFPIRYCVADTNIHRLSILGIIANNYQ